MTKLSINNIRRKSIRKKTASRISAVQVLYTMNLRDISIENSIADYKSKYLKFIMDELDIDKIEEKLFEDLLFGVNDHKSFIDNFIRENLSSKWKLERLAINEINVLRLSVYEICYKKKFDKKTLINEYTSIFKSFGGNPDFANGILNLISKKSLYNE